MAIACVAVVAGIAIDCDDIAAAAILGGATVEIIAISYVFQISATFSSYQLLITYITYIFQLPPAYCSYHMTIVAMSCLLQF